MDGWSVPVLVEELLSVYGGVSLARVTPYREYLGWLARQDHAGALAAWREALAGLAEGTRLAPRAATPGAPIVPEALTVELSAELTAALGAQARREGVTLATVLQALWGVLLGRLSGRSDVVLGVTVAGRPPELAGIERMVGLFINTLPLRVRLVWGARVGELYRQVQESQASLLSHQHVGLAEIQGLAGVGELFDTLLVVENYPVDRERLSAAGGGLRLSDVGGVDGTHYALSVAVVPGERLQLRFGYRADVLTRGEAAGIAERYERLLINAVAVPDRRLGALEILADGERERLLYAWNATSRAVSPGTLASLFAAQVARTPDAVAVIHEDCRLSYRELDEASSRLAHHLRALGVGPEVVVGLCVARSAAMLVGLLGIVKAGGAYLPLDPEYPAERLAFMLSDARAPVVVTQATLRDRLGLGHGCQAVCLDADAAAISAHPGEAPLVPLDPRNTAYVIYTSGSTGTPKGVAVSHGNVLRLRLRCGLCRPPADDAFLQWRRWRSTLRLRGLWRVAHGAMVVDAAHGRFDAGALTAHRGRDVRRACCG